MRSWRVGRAWRSAIETTLLSDEKITERIYGSSSPRSIYMARTMLCSWSRSH